MFVDFRIFGTEDMVWDFLEFLYFWNCDGGGGTFPNSKIQKIEKVPNHVRCLGCECPRSVPVKGYLLTVFSRPRGL